TAPGSAATPTAAPRPGSAWSCSATGPGSRRGGPRGGGGVATGGGLRGGRAPPPGPPPAGLPGELASLVGTSAAYNPWVPEVRVRADAAGTGLVLLLPGGDGGPLDAV